MPRNSQDLQQSVAELHVLEALGELLQLLIHGNYQLLVGRTELDFRNHTTEVVGEERKRPEHKVAQIRQQLGVDLKEGGWDLVEG